MTSAGIAAIMLANVNHFAGRLTVPSPFPGMDPYIEDKRWWEVFHTAFIVGLMERLNRSLPDQNVASSEQRLYIEQHRRAVRPDVSIIARALRSAGSLRRGLREDSVRQTDRLSSLSGCSYFSRRCRLDRRPAGRQGAAIDEVGTGVIL